ncbi:MAG: nucleotidyltransferase family protein [Spirochaetaceae bacterium]|nr:nucleotidyltransferase family protein [Spirochaetaceae bacterium]
MKRDIKELLIRRYVQLVINPRDRLLLDLVFKEGPTQTGLDTFFSSWDIEREGAHKALMLSYFMKMHPELAFPDYTRPRLEGLLNYYRFYNMQTLAHFPGLGRALNRAGIPILVFKGMAMKLLRPELPRVMEDIDFIVPDERYAEAVRMAEDAGFEHKLAREEEHSVDLIHRDKKCLIDIHRCPNLKHGLHISAQLFARARKTNAYGVDMLIPCDEDLVFITLTNFLNNLVNKTSIKGVLYGLFDYAYLVKGKEDFNWDMLIDNARKTKTTLDIRLALEIIEHLVPGIMPQGLKKTACFASKLSSLCTRLVYNEYYYDRLIEKRVTFPVRRVTKAFIKGWFYKTIYYPMKLIRGIYPLRKLFLLIFLHKEAP